VGVASLLIACKYEEIYAPEVKDFVVVTDSSYKREEILDMEGKILLGLSFNLTVPSPLRFLERYSRIAKLDDASFYFARYTMELSLSEYKMLKYIPSMLAAGAVYLVNKINKIEAWPEVLVRNTKFDEFSVKACGKDLL